MARSAYRRSRSMNRRSALMAVATALLAGSPTQWLVAQPDASETPSDSSIQRRIAPAMSYIYADWLTRPEREREEQPDRLVSSLRIPRGSTVIDLGAGVGYFTWRLAKRVGPRGKVIAVEIQPEMLDMLEENLRTRGIGNVESILGTERDPRLPEGVADLALLVDVYHELAYPVTTMGHLRRALKPGGRMVVVEYRKEDPRLPIHPLHKMTVAEVRQEIEPTGFEFVEVMEFLPSQHIIVFARPSE